MDLMFCAPTQPASKARGWWDESKGARSGMPQAIRREIRGQYRFDDSIAIDLRTHVDVQVTAEAFPQAAKAVLILPVPGLRGENGGKRSSLRGEELWQQRGMDGDIPDPGGGLWGLDLPGAALLGGVDVDLVAVKVHI